MKPHVSIVIVHYDQVQYTLTCLESLLAIKASSFKFNILLVDNGSSKKFKLPSHLKKLPLTLLRSDSNLGYTGGNNLGIHQAIERYNSQYVLLLNNDATVNKNTVAELLDALNNNHLAGIACPLIYFSPGREYHKSSYKLEQRGKVVWYAGGCIDWTSLACFHKGVDELDRGQFDHLSETDFATGCCMLIKREVLEKIGFLDKRYFVYFEDTDLSLRAQKVGYHILIVPRAHVWHSNAGSSGGSGSNLQVYYQERNKLLLAWLHGDLIAKNTMIISIIQNLLTWDRIKILAVWHFLTGNLGKQQIQI